MKERPVILVWHHRHEAYRRALMGLLSGVEVRGVEPPDAAPPEAGAVPGEGARVLVTWDLPPGCLDLLPDLAWVQLTGAGVDHFVGRPDLPADVRLTRSLGRFGQQVAEYVLGFLLQDLLDTDAYRQQQERRRWHRQPRPLLADRTVGVVGLGSLGSRLAAVLSAVGARVVGVTRSGEAVPGTHEVSPFSRWRQTLSGLDVLVLAAPLTPETRRMVDAEALSRLPEGATLVNVGRGELVDEAALLEALRSGRLRRAVLDVFSTEPLPRDHPLWTAPGTVITPHVAAPSEPVPIAEEVAANYRRFVAGEPLANEVDRDRGY